MGIARRKAGTVVRCPSCSGQVVVPNPTSEPTEKPHEGVSPPPPVQSPPLFERANFDELFDDAAGGKRSVSRPAAAAAPRPTDQPQAVGTAPGAKSSDFAFDVEPVPLHTPTPSAPAEPLPYSRGPEGIVLSPRTATLLIVATILALALVFIVGMIVGSMLHGAPLNNPPGDGAAAPAWTVPMQILISKQG